MSLWQDIKDESRKATYEFLEPVILAFRWIGDRLHSRWHPTQQDMTYLENGLWVDPLVESIIRAICREEIAKANEHHDY